ncbi:sulfite exporter TauE/SafE family protein [Georgenia sp. EYE_87]|uniref:sulfite exporter TauE/SafE family protein n=1 Tax=Georgenia sp. EYE_87 TaxID=2853448 RepID=UPI002004ACF9|nr:sulfite exporter TauE/SafE family protein [Georgenia sp. EYE_87]MCK6210973.1 sulfite exporter TauE/SafE family protein [Georgenia sp. EYE_87]
MLGPVPELSALAWSLLTLGAVLVGLSKTAVPGAATIAVALFAAVLPARASTGALLVLLMVGDLFAVWSYRAHADLATLRRLVPTVLVGVVAGTAFLAVADDDGVRRTIGAILLALIALTLVRRARPRRAVPRPGRRLVTGTYGVLGGFTTMVANSGGPVMALYFLASSYSINRFLGTAAWFFFTVNLVKTPFSVSLGLIDADSLRLDLVLVPAVVAGALAGRRLARRIDQRVFERLVLALTILSAAYLLV